MSPIKLVHYRNNPKYTALVGRKTGSERGTPCWSCGAPILAGAECHLARKTVFRAGQEKDVRVCLPCAEGAVKIDTEENVQDPSLPTLSTAFA